MRKELFYKPSLLFQRIADELAKRSRLRRIRRTCASWLTHDHIDSMELIEIAAAKGAKVFYDIGANVGSWALLCRALVPDSKIMAFEPLPEHCAEFEVNLKNHQDVRLFRVALGPREELLPLIVTNNSDASSLLPLLREGIDLWSLEVVRKIEVPVVVLDKFRSTESILNPDLIKLDVQGFELAVLQGSTEALKVAKWVLAEVSFRRFYENQVLFSELAGFLATRGYEVHAFGNSMRSGRALDTVDVLFHRLQR